MTKKKVERTGAFKVRDDEGNEKVVSIFTTFVEVDPWSGPRHWLPSTKAHKMPDGGHLNPVEDGSFYELQTSKTWRRI